MLASAMVEARGGAPERSLTQRMDALYRANVVRTHRKELKEALHDRRVCVVDVLHEPHELVETMKVFDLLKAVPKVGRVKANKILVRERISPSKTVGGLTSRQRSELIVALAAYSVRPGRRMVS
jgi:hypothetical protein